MANPLVPTQIVDKNGVTTTRNKKVDAGTSSGRAAGVAAPAGVAPSSGVDDAYLDAFDDVVESAVASGLMRPVKTMNGDRHYSTGDIFVGRAKDGSRIYVELSLEHINKPRRSTELEEVAESWDFSMTGSSKRKHSSSVTGGGQIIEDVQSLASGIGNNAGVELAYLWSKNHLNGIKAGTETQTRQVRDILDKTGERYDFGTIAPQIPDDRGYKYGTGWLYKEVDVQDTARVLEILGNAKNLAV